MPAVGAELLGLSLTGETPPAHATSLYTILTCHRSSQNAGAALDSNTASSGHSNPAQPACV